MRYSTSPIATVIVAVIAVVTTVLFALSSASVGAQTRPGNLVALTNNTVWEIDGSGAVVSSIALPVGHRSLGLCPTLDNRGIAVASHLPLPFSNDWYLHVWRGGQLSTVAQVARPGGVGLQPPQQGLIPTRDSRYLATVPWSVGGTVLVDELSQTVTTLDPGGVTAVAPDSRFGGWFLFGGGSMDHLSEAGVRTSLSIVPGQATFGIGALFTKPASDDVFIAYRGLLEYATQSRTFTTILSDTAYPGILDGVVERTTGTLFLANGDQILRSDMRGRILGTLTRLPSSVYAVTILGSNNLQSRSLARRNAPLSLDVSFPNHPGRPYRVGASFGFTPGFATPVGVVPLNPDPLLVASLQLPGVFVGFSGSLDVRGEARAVVNVPNVPAGLRVFFAAMVTDAIGAPLAVSEGLGVTVR